MMIQKELIPIQDEPKTEKEIKRKGGQVTQRDLTVLKWVGEMYTARFDTVRKLLGRSAGVGVIPQKEQGSINQDNARKLVKKWENLGLVHQKKIFFDDPNYIWLTTEGLRAVGLDYQYLEPSMITLRHSHVVNEVRLYIEGLERYKDKLQWKSERQIRRDQNNLVRNTKKIHIPDAEIEIDGRLVAVEIELTQKSHTRIAAIIRELERRNYAKIWYFVRDDTQGAVEKALESVKKELDTSRFVVRNIKEILTNGNTINNH